jgi:beta-galactosidase
VPARGPGESPVVRDGRKRNGLFPIFFYVGLALLAATFLSGCSGSSGTAIRVPEARRSFLFGVANSGFQVDMGCPTLPHEQCDDRNSDWYQFATSPRMLANPFTFLSGQDPSVVGPGHWELYEADFDLAALDLGLNGFRMGLEWSRIFPVSTVGVFGYENLRALADPAALEHYHRVFDALHARGLTPLVTLNHYTLPAWIHDGVGCNLDFQHCSPRGWLDREVTVAEIAKFAGFVAREFGGEVDLWATLNEPFALLLPGYVLPSPMRSNPPAVFLQADAMKSVFRALIEAHARMYDAVKEADTVDADRDGQASQVGIVYAMSPVEPWDPTNPLDRQAADNLFYLWNMAFLNAVLFGAFDENLDGSAVFRPELANRMDYVGLNYYVRITVGGLEQSLLPQLSPLLTVNPLRLSYQVYPPGLYDTCAFLQEISGLPIYITENNGWNDPDNTTDKELGYMTEHLRWVFHTLEQGIDLRGYFYWSLTDFFEWNQGMRPWGLYEVDPADPAKTRTPRPTATLYGDIVRAGAVPDGLAESRD